MAASTTIFLSQNETKKKVGDCVPSGDAVSASAAAIGTAVAAALDPVALGTAIAQAVAGTLEPVFERLVPLALLRPTRRRPGKPQLPALRDKSSG
ncbi:uncharacterized protein PG998_008368 [Apiospora kogelbergensis]|uniref:uncharacterized protein n=1 Tax=Apiospora kogelbergensis TaxID=1337665 RepID=UPI003131F27B